MKVKELLNDESKWTQRAYAKTKEGKAVFPHDKDAVCYCLIGAIEYCYGADDKRYDVLKKVRIELDTSHMDYVFAWNDTHTFKDVKALVEKLDI